MIKGFIIVLLLTSALLADVKNTTGQIKFDTQFDNQAEMTLNTIGLGIGASPSTNLHVNGNAIVSDQFYVGGGSGTANLNLNGTWSLVPENIVNDITLSGNTLGMIDSSGGNLFIKLPYAGNLSGRVYSLKKTSSDHKVIITGDNLIDSYEYVQLSDNEQGALKVISADGQWWILADKDADKNTVVAADNIIRWYKFEESTGTTASDSASGIDGTLLDSFTFDSNVVPGKIGYRGLAFDGTGERIEVDDLDLPSNYQFSVSLWASTLGDFNGTSTSWGYLITKDQFTGAAPYNMAVRRSDGKFYCYVSGDSVNANTAMNDGEWHHCVMVISGNNLSNYFNGAFQDNILVDHDQVNNENFTIGSSDAGSGYRPFSGNIDDVRVYNKALSSEEVQLIYNLGNLSLP
jgi:hypothetical protein